MPVDLKKDDMGDVITDFYKSDAPQFKGKSKKKRREMAIAAKLSAESALYEKLGSWKQDVKDRDKPQKKKKKKKKTRKQKWRDGGNEKLSNVNKKAENKSMQSVGGFRGAHGASRKSKSGQGPAARIEYRRKSPANTPTKHDTESVKKVGTFVSLKKNVSESRLDRVMNTVRRYTSGKNPEKKAQKAMDAGARAKRLLQRKEYASKVSGSTDIVPDDIRDHKIW